MKPIAAFFLGLFLFGCQAKPVRNQPIVHSFPQTSYAYVNLLSLDTAYLYTDAYALTAKGLVKELPYLGSTFVDARGIPLHPHYRKIRLNARQEEKLSALFRPAPSPDSTVIDKECAPVFRDVMIFYNQHDQPVAQVQLCFACEITNFLPIAKDVPPPAYMAAFDNEGRFVDLRNFFREMNIRVYDRQEALDRNQKARFLPPTSK